MTISKTQKTKIVATCACGCNRVFNPFPIYKNSRTEKNPDNYIKIAGNRGGLLFIPKYIRGHAPGCYKSRKGRPAWNKGLTKELCPTLKKMGFQPGHKPYNDWSHIHEMQRNDPEYRKRWLASKKGQIPWNKGKTKKQYKNGIKSGKEHGNWCGGKNSIVDTAEYKAFCKKILKRDNYTCQHCGDHNHKGRGSRIVLDVHHIIARSENPDLILDPNNVITLCRKCHIETDNYGTKLIHKRRKQRGK